MVRHLPLEQAFVGSNPAWAAKRVLLKDSFLFYKILSFFVDKNMIFSILIIKTLLKINIYFILLIKHTYLCKIYI